MDEQSVLAVVRRGTGLLLVRPASGDGPVDDRWFAPTAAIGADRSTVDVATDLVDRFVHTGPSTPIRTGGEIPLDRDEGRRSYQIVLLEVDDDATARPLDDWEATWALPTDVDALEVEPGVWRAYEAVAPSVRSIAADTAHGSTYLSVRALEVLRDRAHVVATEGGERAELVELARELRAVRPEMLGLKVHIGAALDEGTDPATVEARAASQATAAWSAVDRAARTAGDYLGMCGTVVTFSRSDTVDRTLERVVPDRLVTTVAEPGREGVTVAERWANRADVTLGPDAAIGHLLADGVDAVIVGADGIDANGTVTNKVGTSTTAAAAAAHDVPVVVVADTAKVAPSTGIRERAPAKTVYDGDAPLTVRSDRFDRTPATLIDAYCTEEGLLGLDRIAELAREHDRLLESI